MSRRNFPFPWQRSHTKSLSTLKNPPQRERLMKISDRYEILPWKSPNRVFHSVLGGGTQSAHYRVDWVSHIITSQSSLNWSVCLMFTMPKVMLSWRDLYFVAHLTLTRVACLWLDREPGKCPWLKKKKQKEKNLSKTAKTTTKAFRGLFVSLPNMSGV